MRIYEPLATWIEFDAASALLDSYFAGERPPKDIDLFRLRKAPFKRLSDEVVPIIRYLRETGFEGSVQFPFSNTAPDCWILATGETKPRGVEVTIAQARERVLLSKELNEAGQGRGYLGLPDTAPQEQFDAKLAKPRAMYSPEGALATIGGGIKSLSNEEDQTPLFRFRPSDCRPSSKPPARTMEVDRGGVGSGGVSHSVQEGLYRRQF